jgi:hypothetical protein
MRGRLVYERDSLPATAVYCVEKKPSLQTFLLVTLNDGGIVEKTAACANGWELGLLCRLSPEKYIEKFTRSRTLECTISLRFSGIILIVHYFRIPNKVITVESGIIICT